MRRRLRIGRSSRIVFYLIVAVFATTFAGCASDELSGSLRENQPPQVWLSLAPPEGSVGSYRVSISWGGWDPDGQIAYYEYSITDNGNGVFDPADTTGADKWHRVYGNDSTFIFSADLVADSSEVDPDDLKPVEFRQSHTFFIRSVDDRGAASRKPEYRSFTSRTLSPVVDILIPLPTGNDPALVSRVSTFEWFGEDYVTALDETQDPQSVRWILVPTDRFNEDWQATLDYIRANPDAPEWSEWADYAANDSWTTPELDWGGYIFAVQVMDEAGAVSPVYDEDRNVRRVLVSERTTGPLVRLYNEYFGSIVTSSTEGPLYLVDLPGGVPIEMMFTADASFYGGIVTGYRFSWDGDIDDVEWTPFVSDEVTIPPRQFSFDSHGFGLDVMDNWGYITRIRIRFNVVPFTMGKNLLLLDDWNEGEPGVGFAASNGAHPSDAEHDDFWRSMLDELEGFDPDVDVIDLKGASSLPISVLADYRSLIWSAPGYLGTGQKPLLNDIIRFVDPRRPRPATEKLPVNILAVYMAAGGHVMLCGERVMTNAIDSGTFGVGSIAFPLILRYELGGDQDGTYEDSEFGSKGIGELSFAYRSACLDVLDAASLQTIGGVWRGPNQSCAVDRDNDLQAHGLRVALPLGVGYPQLELRPEVADPGRAYAEDRSGLNTDIYSPPYFRNLCSQWAAVDPPRDCFEPIYGLGCVDDQSVIYSAPVAYWTDVYADRAPDVGGPAARSTVWGFHPVYFNPDQVKTAVEQIVYGEWKLPRRVP
ncbi:MAG: hypothetical protein JSW50_12530 [Candidatus Latescibacterota bacterium]|nr:MAG: hypothetical protein JSW50_12530 [Candidatus Latescibacterota bacterium]